MSERSKSDTEARVEAGFARMEAMQKELDGEGRLSGLTRTEQRRTVAALAGSSGASIAKAEGVSRQAVEHTLKSRNVKSTLHELIDSGQLDPDGNGHRWLIDLAVETIGGLMFAEKAAVFGAQMKMVPDNATRLAAALAIIRLHGGSSETEEMAIETTIARSRSTKLG